MAERDNLLVAEQVVSVLKAHDLDRYLKRFLCGGERIQKCCKGATRPGRLVEMYFEAFPDLRVESQHILTQVRLTGTHKGDFLGIAATNKPFNIQRCAVSEIRNGKITRSRVYSENAKLYQQLGVLALPKTATAG